jgi:uncharacterized protein (DUF1499 family)
MRISLTALVKWLLGAIMLAAVLAVAVGQLGMLRSSAPTDLGVRDGKLKAPSATENSVTSQAALYPDHPQRGYAEIAPLPVRGDGPATMSRIRAIVQGMDGAEVVKADPDYLYAQFTTPLMKFVDDVEFWYDPANNVVQFRSASRLGRKDMGVNRKRMEAVRDALATSP